MQVQKTNLENSRVKLTITLDNQEWQNILNTAVQAVASEMRIDGFRPGNAPREIVVQKAGEAKVISAATEKAIEEFYPKAAKQEGIRPITFPSISVDKVGLDEALEFSAEVAILPEVTLGDYTQIKVSKPEITIDDKDVEDVLTNMQKKAAEFNPVERAAAQGDWVEIDFTGSMEGKEFEGGTSKNHPLVIGDNLFIPGFEEGIVGMNAGEEKTIDVTFPAEYHAKELAGKQAQFQIKLNKVKAINYPDIDDAFAKKFAQMETIASLREDIKKFLRLEAEQKAMEKMKEEAILALAKLAQMELSDEIIDQEVDAMVHDLKHQAEHMKMTFEEYLTKNNVTEESLRDTFRIQAIDRIKAGLALEAFRKAEGVEVGEEDIDNEIEMLKVRYPDDAERIDEEYSKPASRDKLKGMLSSRKAIDKLVELATQ